MDSLERVSSRMQPKYVTSEYCFNVIIFSGFEFSGLMVLNS